MHARLGTRLSLGAGGARARMVSGSTMAQADVSVTYIKELHHCAILFGAFTQWWG